MKRLLSMLIVFVISVCNICNAISREEIEDAIAQGELGDYLILKNDQDPGVKQFLNHCKKHFCDPNDITTWNVAGNQIDNHHTVLGDGDWGHNNTYVDAIRWILNSVTVDKYAISAANTLTIQGLRISDVPQFNTYNMRQVRIYKRLKRGKILREETITNTSNLEIKCGIHFNAAMNSLNTGGPVDANGVGVNGAAGYCYVAS